MKDKDAKLEFKDGYLLFWNSKILGLLRNIKEFYSREVLIDFVNQEIEK